MFVIQCPFHAFQDAQVYVVIARGPADALRRWRAAHPEHNAAGCQAREAEACWQAWDAAYA